MTKIVRSRTAQQWLWPDVEPAPALRRRARVKKPVVVRVTVHPRQLPLRGTDGA